MVSRVLSRKTTKDSGKFSFIASQWFIISVAVLSLLVGVLSGLIGPYAWVVIIGSVIMASLIIFRQDELAAALILAIHLNIDWYLGFRVISLVLMIVLLCSYYVGRSHLHPWVRPNYLWLWLMFLGLTLIPAVRGAIDLYDALYYYPNVIFSAFLIFWLGSIISRTHESIRRFFKIFSFYCSLVALHTIIQARTGIFLFSTSRLDTQIAQMVNNHLPGMIDVSRVGSFLVDPNWAGAFFAMTLFIPLGLLVESPSVTAKFLYLVEAILISLALLFTFSAGSWLAAAVAAVIFLLFLGGMGYRAQFLICLLVAAMVMMIGFFSHLGLLAQHASDPTEVLSHVGAWRTAVNVIRAFPLAGVGLGQQLYILQSASYMVPEQLIPLGHPHNSYLEWAAMAGLPVLFVFVALLLFNIRWAIYHWRQSHGRDRCLLAVGLAAIVALSVNSFTVNAWTLPPLAALGWLLLGVISSPLLKKRCDDSVIAEPKTKEI